MSIIEHTHADAATISLTDSATGQIQNLLQEQELSEHALRVFVSGGGCSGLQYGMTLDDQPRDTDHRIEHQGIQVIIDPLSMDYLMGATIDYEDNLMGGGFRIDNPNAIASCGCGNSFQTSEAGEDNSHASASGSCGCS